MGTGIDQETFAAEEYGRFHRRLTQCLTTLERLLARPGFGVGPVTLGAELELFLVDPAARPLLLNQAVRAATGDRRVTLELDRFNLELNATPTPMAGRPFTALGEELRWLLDRVAHAAAQQGGRVALVGILPTLRLADLHPGVMTDLARYRALNRGLRRLHQDPFRIRIAGADPLELASEDVALEGANTSFQVHLRVDPAAFTRTYNAVQLATAPVLAVAGNSPTLLGHRLWERPASPCASSPSMIATAAGSAAGRPGWRSGRAGCGRGRWHCSPRRCGSTSRCCRCLETRIRLAAGELGQAPPLAELRLHQGTVWRWNRPVYDPALGGHLRIELRALPAGPTVTDMLANAAFLVGLSRWLASQDERWTYRLSFERAEHGFYRAAQHGLAAELTWPFGGNGRLRTLPAAKLIAELLPAAWHGLVDGGVAAEEAGQLLGVIAARVRSGQTGAVWQRRVLAGLEPRLGRERALVVMLERYLELAATDQPVHTWPTSP